jgi:rod shape-determining protein MreB
LALDLGTWNTVVFRRGAGIVLFEQSVLAIDVRSGHVQSVGQPMIGRTPAHIKACRPLRHGVIADLDATEVMLRHFLHRVNGGRRRANVMVCVPSGITQVERVALLEATVAAGAAGAALIEKPVAAALGAGLPATDSVGSLVVDLGGGTTEVAIIALGGLVVAQSVRVGGIELDEAIVRLVRERDQLLIGLEQAEAVKMAVGSAIAGVDGARSAEVAGRDRVTGLVRRVEVEAEHVRSAFERPLAQIVGVVKDLLESVPPELVADVADRGLMLVGGGALLRGVDELFRRETGLPATVAEDPLTTIASGAGQAIDRFAPRVTVTAGRRRYGASLTGLAPH